MSINEAPIICSLNFHTTVGGTQRTLAMALPALTQKYTVRVIDPYRNPDFERLMIAVGLPVETVVDLSKQTRLSIHQGVQRAFDYGLAVPRYLQAATQLGRYFKEVDAALIYVNQTKSAAVALLAASTDVPIVFHCHDAEATGIQLIAKLQRRFVRVIANSVYTGERLARLGFDRNRIRILVNAVDVGEIQTQVARGPVQPVPRCQRPPIILLAHAGIEPNKGTLIAIEAFGNLVTQGLPGELWIMGDVSPAQEVYAARVKQQITELGITNRVHLLGRRSDVFAVMAMADIVLVPTIYREHFGRVAVEAMALGKCVAVSNRGALPTLVENGISGRVFDPDQPDDLENTLRALIIDPDLAGSYGQAGLERIREHYSVDRFQRELISEFSALLK
jgi:glycosyltransferase involved in cell wall biosynthesis